MIALCPECKTRYRLAREKVGPQGARIRCSRCQTVFRVQPSKPAQAPSPAQTQQSAPAQQAASPPPTSDGGKYVARALVAEADGDAAKRITKCLLRHKIAADVIPDGGQALLQLFRKAPDIAILGGHLPGVSAPIIAEIARRAGELRNIPLVRIAPMDEPAVAPEFEAKEVLEPAEIDSKLGTVLERLSIGAAPSSEPDTDRLPVTRGSGAPPPAQVSPPELPVPEPPAPEPPAAEPAKPKRRRSSESSSDDPAIVAAERLARISVSDIILYNEEKFAKAVRGGNVAAGLEAELAEARHLFQQRVPEEVRAIRDFLVEELERRAASRAS